MSAIDKLRRLRDRLGAKSVAANWSQEPGHRFVRMDDVDAEIDRILAEQTPEPGAFIWQCACGSRNVVSSAVCTKCGNGRPNSALPLTGPNYMDQEEWGHAPAPATDAEIEAAIDRCSSGEHVEESSAALRALIARRVAAAEKELDEARAELAKVLKREADGVALFDELLARERAEVAQLKEKLTRWDIDYDRVHKEAKDLRAEVERLRAGGCARDQTTTQFCAEAVALQRENERLRNDLAAQDRATQALVQRLTGGDHEK